MSFFVKACVARAEGVPGGQRRDRRRRHRSTRTTTTSASPSAPTSGLVVPVLRDADAHDASPRSRRPSATSASSARDGKLKHGRPAGRHLHHHQRRHLRLADVDADPQRAAVRHSRHAQDPGPADGGRRPGRDPPDDVSRPQLRPPHRRRHGGRDLPGARQGSAGGSGAAGLDSWAVHSSRGTLRRRADPGGIAEVGVMQPPRYLERSTGPSCDEPMRCAGCPSIVSGRAKRLQGRYDPEYDHVLLVIIGTGPGGYAARSARRSSA
jgi:hypothetical protein